MSRPLPPDEGSSRLPGFRCSKRRDSTARAERVENPTGALAKEARVAHEEVVMRLLGYALMALGVMTAIAVRSGLDSAPSAAGQLPNPDFLRALGAI